MTNREISDKAFEIIKLNQQYMSNQIKAQSMGYELDTIMKDMPLEDLLVLGCALTYITEQTERTLQK